MELIKPKRLKFGDTIGILGVSGSIKDIDKLENSKLFLENNGFKVRLSDNIYDDFFGMAGNTQVRLKALHDFFKDNTIDAILCARGGFGTLKLINQIDYNLIRENPKIFVGLSDITNLLAMFLKKAGLITFYGAMPYVDFSNPDQFTVKSFFETLMKEQRTFTTFGKSILFDKYKTEKLVSGIIFGGNLSTLTSLVSDIDFLPQQDFILFIEDLNDPTYKVDRMLEQFFNLQTVRKYAKALLVGDFLNIDHQQYFEFILRQINERFRIPVLTGFKFSHDRKKQTIPFGPCAEINFESQCLTISQHYLQ